MSYSTEVTKLVAEGSKFYGTKDYDLAAEKYASANELYNEEQDDNDADLLLLYGKSLFQVAVTKSEVFGGNVENGDEDQDEDDKEGEEEKNSFFQFSDDAEVDGGDQKDNEEDGDEEEGEPQEGEEGEDEPEQSDFEVAWEILDLTRSLFEAQLEDLQETSKKPVPKGPLLSSEDEETTDSFVILKKKISETYDLLGEVSLEAENFQQSAVDLETALELRKELYPEHSSLVSESYYKLSLALEFCVEDANSRDRAVEMMTAAIESVKKRGEVTGKPDDELVQDLNVRLLELKKDPTEEIKAEQMKIIQGILGEPSSEDAKEDTTKDPVSSASASATPVNDLTSMVKKRKAPTNKMVAKKPKSA